MQFQQGLVRYGGLCIAALAVLTGCGGGGTGNPDPTPTPKVAETKVQVLRDAAQPRLSLTVDGVGGPTFLVGQRLPLYFGEGEGQIAKVDTNACSVSARWTGLNAFLDAAKANKINMLHVELWSVWYQDGLFPFNKDAAGKFKVQAAVENNEWNAQYFNLIRQVVDGASDRGMVVFFTFFNHYNIRIQDGPGGKPWAAEPIRAQNTDTGFGLDDYSGNWKLRTATFVKHQDSAGNLTTMGKIQKALIERLMDEINHDNVIFEPIMVPWIYNNPDLPPENLSRWENWVISVIRAKEAARGKGFRGLIEVTPAPYESLDPVVNGGVNKVFDVGEWRKAYNENRPGFENWSQVDMIAYAGSFAFNDPPFGPNGTLYANERMTNHLRQFPDKMVLYSTDGFNQRYAPDKCTASMGNYVKDVRHGWWEILDLGNDLSQYPLQWARLTFNQTNQAPLGYVHFLNWTTAQSSMEDLGKRTF